MMNTIESSMTQEQIDFLIRLEEYYVMFHNKTLTMEHRIDAYVTFHRLFPEDFARITSGAYDPTDLKHVNKYSQLMIFHSHFDFGDPARTLYSAWHKHIYSNGLHAGNKL